MTGLHSLQTKSRKAIKKRVGRGGKRGKTSGRGHKGQNARAGTSGRTQMRDWIKKLPKLRGFGNNRARTVNDARVDNFVLNLTTIDTTFKSGDTVSFDALLEAGLVSKRGNKRIPIKILGDGDISIKVTVDSGISVSASAKEKIEKAGGEIK